MVSLKEKKLSYTLKGKLDGTFYQGLGTVIFGIVFMLVTPSQVKIYQGSDALSPRLIPYIILSLIVVCGVILMFQSLFKKPNLVAEVQEQIMIEDNSSDTTESKSITDLLIFIATPVFILFTAEHIGYTVIAIISLFILLMYYNVRPWYKALIVSLIVPICIELLYRTLGIYLPLGILENLIY